jgi:enterochelin esterase-like enzyme
MKFSHFTFLIILFFITFACSDDDTVAEPEPTTFSLTLVYEGEGTVESDKSGYSVGESVTVAATADEGFYFNAWYEDKNRISGDAVYSFSMPERDLTLRAVFSPSIPEPSSESTLDRMQTLTSRILGDEQPYTIYLPPGYNDDPEREYPILYLLHGLGQNHTSWATNGNLKAIADQAIADGTCQELIIVCPEAYATFYVNGYYQEMDYEDYFIDEFISAIESTYRVKASKEGRSISGLSMGGYGCTYHAFSRPEMFSSCFAMSAAFTGTYPQVGDIVIRSSEEELTRFPAFVMECGTEDFGAYPMNNNLNRILQQTTLDYTYTTRPGRHDWAFWQECLPKALKLASDNFSN